MAEEVVGHVPVAALVEVVLLEEAHHMLAVDHGGPQGVAVGLLEVGLACLLVVDCTCPVEALCRNKKQ